jgi:BirA family biotin operon repressor/biotin-[acetyl-CoA-carboxylase] ligase
MDWAHSMIDSAPDGSVFLADKYTVARGQHGREWKLYPGQLILTLLLKPEIGQVVDRNFLLQEMKNGIASSVVYTLNEFIKTCSISIKQPNDFMCNGKKLGGMLTEAVWMGPKLKGVVVGVALNCNNSFHKKDKMFPIATSIFDATGIDVEISELREQLLFWLDKWYKGWRSFARLLII